MANSAWSGNTAGLATAVSPGLVGTSTQTFAGDKTLTGLITASGGILNTGLTGANATAAFTAGSGKVGETVKATTSTIFSLSSPGSGSFYGVPNLSLNIPTAGVWLVGYNCSLQVSSPTGASAEVYGRSKLRNNTDIIDICGAISSYSVVGTNSGIAGNGSAQSVINISEPKTIQVYIEYSQNGGVPVVSDLFERADRTIPYSQVFAIRIA